MDSVMGMLGSQQGINPQFLRLSPKNHHHCTTKISFSSIKPSSSVQLHQNPNTKPPIKTLSSSSFLKNTCVAITAASLFFNRFTQPSIAANFSPPALVEVKEHYSAASFSQFDAEALKSVLEVKTRLGKIAEAILICDRLILLEPAELEWILKKSHFLARNKDYKLAGLGFEEVISKDPLNIDAYFGLISCINDSGSGEYGNVLKRIEKAMKICKQENKKLCLREFKLFVAQILVLQREYSDALKIYEQLVEENMLDCRPYLCQGIVYTLLKKPNKAMKCFENYGILGPKGHPYARRFEGVF
ncbi:hypothetical protein MKW92_050349 [Papaver armeniacum]|nr:hypothetical protein MKW92_050349 [Papaver armeniacum]